VPFRPDFRGIARGLNRRPCPSGLTDEQWRLIEPLLPPERDGGRPREVDLREVLNGIFYPVKCGIPRRYMPPDLPPWGTVPYFYRQWRLDGTWEEILDVLRTRVRREGGRPKSPAAATVDSQAVKTAEGGGKGYDAGRRIAGRKRHIPVDTLGLLMAVVVHSAGVQDRDGIKPLLQRAGGRFPRLRLIWADAAYEAAVGWVRAFGGWLLDLIRKPLDQRGSRVLPRRWVVERTSAWLARYRRNSRDYERRTESSEAMIRLAAIHMMLRRLKPS